uniref:Uncharacterized protein n=1 Tax=Timema genevievae TaxID=629358 RepID=A0A7R9PL04_TIMGE|nr:unnamed protein product [Timema genevievae]
MLSETAEDVEIEFLVVDCLILGLLQLLAVGFHGPSVPTICHQVCGTYNSLTRYPDVKNEIISGPPTVLSGFEHGSRGCVCHCPVPTCSSKLREVSLTLRRLSHRPHPSSLLVRQFNLYKTPGSVGHKQQLEGWLTTWRTSINVEKSTAVLFTWKRKCYRPAPLQLFGEQIRWADSAKYLGLTLDTKLTWRLHCTERLTKAKQRLGILGPLLNRRSALSTRNGLTLYKQLLRPILDYANFAICDNPSVNYLKTTRCDQLVGVGTCWNLLSYTPSGCIRACYFASASATQTQFQSCIRRLTSLVSVKQYSNQEDIRVTMMVLSDSPARSKNLFSLHLEEPKTLRAESCSGEKMYIALEVNPHSRSYDMPFKLKAHSLYTTIINKIEQLYGDFGVAALKGGFMAKYCNEKTRVAFVRARHGPHRLLASCLPFVNKIENRQVMLRILYTGATLRQCYKFIQKYQRLQLQRFWANLKTDKQRKEMEDAVMDLKITKVPTEVALDESGPDGSHPLVGAHIPYMNLFHGSFRILRWELMASDGDVVQQWNDDVHHGIVAESESSDNSLSE